MKKEKAKELVKEAYGKIALSKKGCGCGSCGTDAGEFAKGIGYSEEELKNIPEEANLGLSCGNPVALASLKTGETVLDLGSGAGFDCFLASSRVGPRGRVVGVDMTPEMVEKARANALKNGVSNVDFRLGEIEALPLEDNSIDVVISNCVLNLSPEKEKVFREIYRVLKPGGRVAISDIALKKVLPQKIREDIKAYIGCVSGAVLLDEYRKIVEASGLTDVKLNVKENNSCIAPDTKDPLAGAILEAIGSGEKPDDYVAGVYLEARK